MSDAYEACTRWQKQFVDTVIDDLSTFPKLKKRGTIIPGPPGTGKTFATNVLTNRIRRDYPGLRLEITATTGAAASRLSGDSKTLATFLSLGLEAMKLHHRDEIMRIIQQRNPERVLQTDVLIIDEVSMFSKRHFDNLNDILRHLRQNPKPFGGMYVILIGDPFQLPPVPHDSGGGVLRKEKEFVESCLETELDGFNYIVPNEMKRSEDDPLLREMLLSMISPNPQERIKAMNILVKHCYDGEMDIDEVLDEQERTGAVILSSAKEGEYSVGAYNCVATERAKKSQNHIEIRIPPAVRLHDETEEILRGIGGKRGLEAEEEAITERDSWTNNETLLSSMPSMIRSNMITQEGIRVVNGDLCHVLNINSDGVAKVKLLKNGQTATIPRIPFQSEWENKIGYEACPLIPCAAMTVHKSQGATLEKGIIFETRRIYNGEYMAHMLYTAFSRVKKLSDIRITSYLIPEQLNHPLVQKKIDFVWMLSFMEHYLRP